MSDDPKQTEATIDIENSGNAASVLMHGATVLSIHIRGDATAEYQVDVRKRGGDWIQNVGTEHTGASDYDEVYTTGAHEVRVRCSSGSGGADDQATITLMAGGG